jgi:polyhydroxyalkanoate synthesis repressor PhaR
MHHSADAVGSDCNGGVDRLDADPYIVDMTSPIVLKKYGNRRLYDTRASRYVTLGEVEEMLQRGDDIQVLDAKTSEDLTKEILVQIILDRERAREMLPTSFLKQIVRVSSTPLRDAFTRTLQDTLDSLNHGQRAWLDAQRAMAGNLAQAPMLWNPFAAFAGPPPAQPAPAAPPASARDEELERLRSEVGETQKLLRELLAKPDKPRGRDKRARRSRA